MKNIKTLDQIKDQYYGVVGTPKRDDLERELESLRVRLKIKKGTIYLLTEEITNKN